MAGTINYSYDPSQTVWIITSQLCGTTNVLSVIEGAIVQVIGTVLNTGTTLEYKVRLEGTGGLTPLAETDIFPTLAAAIIEYEIRLT